MFITEQQLFELKYQAKSEYFGKCLAEIFFLKYKENDDLYDFFEIIKPFYHKFHCDEQCSVKFDDNSILLIEKDENKKWSQIKIFSPDHLYIYKQFKRMG